MTDTSQMTEIKSISQFFIIDDFLIAFWCKLVGCDMKPPPEKKKEEPKKEEKVTTVKQEKKAEQINAENDTKPANTSSASQGNSTSGPGLDDDILRQIRERKAVQNKDIGTDALGKKEADNAKTVTDNKKDMAVPEPGKETMKDETP